MVLNDAGYGMCRDGHNALGLTDDGVDFPRVDFAAMVARSVGAEAARSSRPRISSTPRSTRRCRPSGPFVVDVRIDASEPSPLLKRFESLIKQGNSKNVAGWEA